MGGDSLCKLLPNFLCFHSSELCNAEFAIYLKGRSPNIDILSAHGNMTLLLSKFYITVVVQEVPLFLKSQICFKMAKR